MPNKKKTTKTEKAKPSKNTMKIILINSAGDVITATGKCSDKEIKAICRAILHGDTQTVKIDYTQQKK